MPFRETILRVLRWHGLNLLLITAVSAVTCWIYWAPNLTGDDWMFLNSAVTGQYYWLDFRIGRPLEGLFSNVLFLLAGVNMPIYFVSNWLIWLFICLAFYFLLARILSSYGQLPIIASLIFCIYPIYQLRMWLTANHPNFALLFTVLFAWLLYEYKRHANWRWLVAALFVLIVSFLDYEGQLGLVTFWSLFLAGKSYKSRRKRIGLLSPLLVTLAYIGWRFIRSGQPGMPLDTASTYWISARQILSNPLILPDRLFAGIKVIFTGWIAPWMTVDLNAPFLWSAFFIILFLCLATLIVIWWNSTKMTGISEESKDHLSRKNLLKIIILSGSFAIIGYIPMIILYPPALDFFSSRANLFAIPGASIMIATIIMVVATLAKNFRRQLMNSALILIFFIASGSISQIQVQYESRRVWCEQASIWTKLKSMAPDVKDGSYIGIVFKQSHYGENTIVRDAIVTPWEVNFGLKLVYDNQTLSGGVTYLNRPDLSSFSDLGITVSWPPRTEPYAKAVLFLYDETSDQLQLIKTFDEIGFQNNPDYVPESHILPFAAHDSPYLSLITPCSH